MHSARRGSFKNVFLKNHATMGWDGKRVEEKVYISVKGSTDIL